MYKTPFDLLKKANQVGGIVICENPIEMKRSAYSYCFFYIQFVRYEDSIHYYFDKPVFIDDIEKFAKVIVGRNFSGFTGYLGDKEI